MSALAVSACPRLETAFSKQVSILLALNNSFNEATHIQNRLRELGFCVILAQQGSGEKRKLCPGVNFVCCQNEVKPMLAGKSCDELVGALSAKIAASKALAYKFKEAETDVAAGVRTEMGRAMWDKKGIASLVSMKDADKAYRAVWRDIFKKVFSGLSKENKLIVELLLNNEKFRNEMIMQAMSFASAIEDEASHIYARVEKSQVLASSGLAALFQSALSLVS